MTTPSPKRRPIQGFSLVELAIVLVVLALLTGGLLVPLTIQLDTRDRGETQRQLDEARDALYGFAVAQGYLPCPAVPGGTTGQEDRSPSSHTCNRLVGMLPWATLGLPRYDAYGRHFRYSVASNLSTTFDLTANGNIRIKTRNASGVESDVTNNDVAAVVLSHGRNGAWGYRDGVLIGDTSGTNSDEDVNGNGDGRTFYVRESTGETSAAGGEIDDLLIWIPTTTLLGRMVAARKLP